MLSDEHSPIITSPHPVLRTPTEKIETFDATLQSLAQRMTSTMDAFSGVGLAAPQISSALRLALIRIDDERVLPLANAEIEEKEGQTIALEGCLSLPGLQVPVVRSEKIRLRAQDLSGEEFVLDLEGLPARIAQHEIDHLNGRLIIDYFWSLNNKRRGYEMISS